MYDNRTHMSVFLNQQHYPNFWPAVTILDQVEKVK